MTRASVKNMKRLAVRVDGIAVTVILAFCVTGCSARTTPNPEDHVPTSTPSQVEMELLDASPTPGVLGGTEETSAAQPFILTSPAFGEGAPIPVQYTCDGEDVSPALSWRGIPEGTETLALIMDDPDAPGGIWVHWILFNIPRDKLELLSSIPTDAILSDGSQHGLNSWGRRDYGGPCPPQGTHRYFFKLYALDTALDVVEGADAQMLYDMMQGHIVAEAAIIGTYAR